MATATREVTIRAKAFTGEPMQEYQVRVEDDGDVLVFDAVAGHYTRCHILSQSAQRRARKLVRS
jgi:hypothetical protein